MFADADLDAAIPAIVSAIVQNAGQTSAAGSRLLVAQAIYEPLLCDVPPGHRLMQEEIFGSVLCAMRFQDEDQAVELANATRFGLAAGIWTRDGALQLRMARRVKSGQVFINHYGAGGDVELPFGSVKSSGHGREKGLEALHGFTTLKTVAIKHG